MSPTYAGRTKNLFILNLGLMSEAYPDARPVGSGHVLIVIWWPYERLESVVKRPGPIEASGRKELFSLC